MRRQAYGACEVLTQNLHPQDCPESYYSTQLDAAAAGNYSYVKAMAATAITTKRSRHRSESPTTMYTSSGHDS